ncbi:hypothetical protein N656DRAFT_18021 [Canariomyces notabilis]|uniref:Uncharacterized protein n=1 Tax=Canariomyces notabilis TaxID=2074819 RepID=A0AAN6YX00_9PEZI|nr:hypothetical protein N656DRAFT_18021 [Canariomyces arenarius]
MPALASAHRDGVMLALFRLTRHCLPKSYSRPLVPAGKTIEPATTCPSCWSLCRVCSASYLGHPEASLGRQGNAHWNLILPVLMRRRSVGWRRDPSDVDAVLIAAVRVSDGVSLVAKPHHSSPSWRAVSGMGSGHCLSYFVEPVFGTGIRPLLYV